MSVSLVKITPATVVYVVGYAYGPYMPDGDHLTVCTTIDAAREALAYELERAAELTWEQEMNTARDEYADEADYSAHLEEAHEASTSISGSAELVKSDRDGDVTYQVTRFDGWATGEPDGYSYWIHASTLGEVFGDNTDTAEYWDVVDALLDR
jgi:hypothetical protein